MTFIAEKHFVRFLNSLGNPVELSRPDKVCQTQQLRYESSTLILYKELSSPIFHL